MYWLFKHNHVRNRDEEILGMNVPINAIESCMGILECMTVEDIRSAPKVNEHFSILSNYMICSLLY